MERTAISHSILSELGQAVEKIIQPTPKQAESRHSLFDSSLLSKRLAQSEYAQPQLKSGLIRTDLEHTARELMLGEIVTSWEMVIGTNEELVGGGYLEDLGSMTHNFIDVLADDSKDLSRAELEARNTQQMKQWALQNVDQPKVLIWTSPPDTEESGYHGSSSKHHWDRAERHHSFFYVMRAESNGQGEVILKTDQVRGWPNMRQLIEIQTNFDPSIEAGFSQFNDHDGNITFQLVDNMITLEHEGSYQQALTQIIDTIFLTKEKWLFNEDHMPQLDFDQFWQEFNHLTNDLYLAEALPLFDQIPLDLEKDDSYFYSNEYQQILDQLDTLFDYWSMSLQQWIDDHDENPLSQQQSLLQKIKQLRHLPLEIMKKMHAAQKKEDEEKIPVQTIRRMYRIDVNQRVFSLSPSKADKKFFLANLNWLSFTGRAFSLAQCGIVAPFTMPISAIRGIGLGQTGQLTIAFEKMPFEMQQQFLANLKDYVPLKMSGVGQEYMVPRSYLGECWVEAGQIMGPCGIPLDLDPDAIPLSANQLANIIGGLDNAMQAGQAATLKNSLLNSAQTEEQRQQAGLVNQILEGIFNKSSLGLTETITNDTTKMTVAALNVLPTELLRIVQAHQGSFDQLTKRIVTKLQRNYSDIIDKLPGYRQLQTQLNQASN